MSAVQVGVQFMEAKRRYQIDGLYHAILESEVMDADWVQEELNRCGIPYQSFPMVVIFDLKPSGTLSTRFMREEVRDYFESSLDRCCGFFLEYDQRLGMVMPWEEWSRLPCIHRIAEKDLHVTITLGIGSPCMNLSQLHRSYRQAYEALNESFYQGQGSIIYSSQIRPYGQPGEYPLHMEETIFECLKSKQSDVYESNIDTLIDDFFAALLSNGKVPAVHIYDAAVRLLVSLENKLHHEMHSEQSLIKSNIVEILQIKSLAGIKIKLKSYFQTIRDILSSVVDMSHHIVKKAITYMEQEYSNATLLSIAEKVLMTPTYLSLLFKLHTGKTFIEQLTDIRIRKAKHLLTQTSFKTYEVAEKIGYQDARYFSQIFKKKVGLSPSNFRENIDASTP
jgi:two-component system response regulator YesN